MRLTICTANCTGNQKNCIYPNKRVITSKDELKEAVKLDHVCAEYKNNYRSADNFLKSDVIVMDCDNDLTENPEEWITPEALDDLLSDVSYAIAPSRHNMISKDGKAPRPKFHVYFSVEEIEETEEYVVIKRAIHSQFPFFDDNALDAARFIYGAVAGDVIWHEGWLTIVEVLENIPAPTNAGSGNSIPEGRRNNTLSRFAGRVVKRYGSTDKAHQIFQEEAKKCDPPMEDEELAAIWNSAIKFVRKVQSQDGYVPPDKYNLDFESLKPPDFSDIGQAKVLVREYGNELCYTDATDYLRFNGEYWVESKQQSIGVMEEFLDLQLQDALDEVESTLNALVALGERKEDILGGGKKYEASLEGDLLEVFKKYQSAVAYRAFVMKRRDMKYVISALQAAKPMLEIKVSDLDKDEFLLNTPGLTFDLRKGLSGGRAPDAADYITKQTTASPGDQGEKIWLEALNTFFCNDEELIEYVQQIVGLSAIGKVYLEAIIIAYGGGRNGKSTFWNSISRVLGSYSGAISADTLTVGCRRNVKPEMAELKGKRLIIAAELEEGMRLNTSMIKQLCSTDEITAEKKYKDPFKFEPSHTIVLYTNHLPRVGANDEGTWRRLIVIPFNAKIEGNSDIKNYADHLVKEAGPSIMGWIIEGARKAIRSNFHFTQPRCVRNAIEVYRENNDWMANFLDDCCEIGPDFNQKSGAFYQEYREYCIRNGEYTRSTTDFYAAVEHAGFLRRKTNKGSFIYGVRLKPIEFLE
jgi:putative DNA primase/helicase